MSSLPLAALFLVVLGACNSESGSNDDPGGVTLPPNGGLQQPGAMQPVGMQPADGMQPVGMQPAPGGDTGQQPTGGTGGTGAMPPGDMMVPDTMGPMSTPVSGCSMPVPSTAPGNACPGTPPPAIKLTPIAEGLSGPTYVTQAPGDPTRLYVLEQQGVVKVIKDGTLSPTPVIDMRAMVNSDEIVPGYAEGGLLGMVFHPDFANNGRVWLSYTVNGPAFVVTEFNMSNPDSLDVSSSSELLKFPMYPFLPVGQATNHVGSMLAFGPDGCMYISRGDGGGENDRQNSGQDTSDDLCSILRIDPDTYPAPAPGNFDGHVWSYGFRNPWRFSFDRETGDMYIGDVGQNANTGFEEIMVEPRGVSGRNYGWSVAEGSTRCSGNCAGMTPPALEYGITGARNSVIGGYVYRGSAMPGMVGRYIWADWTEREIKTFVYSGESAGMATICDEYSTGVLTDRKVRSFGEDLAGEIYVVVGGPPANGLTSASPTETGAVFRIDPM